MLPCTLDNKAKTPPNKASRKCTGIMHRTAGDSAAFSSIFPWTVRQDRLAWSLYCSQAESTPAHLPLSREDHTGWPQSVSRQLSYVENIYVPQNNMVKSGRYRTRAFLLATGR